MKSLIEDSICDVINNYPAFFFNKKNVTGIGYGNKVKKNLITKEPTLHVFVEEKLPLNQLYSHEIIPKNFFGLKTDVIETGKITQDINQLTMGKEIPQLLKELNSRNRPIKGGMSIGPENSKSYGTLGIIVHGISDDYPYILSAGHVLTRNGKNKKGSKIYQPARTNCYKNICGIYSDLVNKNAVAKLSKWNFINYDESSDNYIDAGIAKLNSNVRYSREIYDNGPLTGLGDLKLRDYIYKIGASTGLTVANVLSLHNTIKIDLPKGNSYILKEQASSIKFSKSGDSGSVVFNSNEKLLALVIASSKDYSFFTPIRPILRDLNVYFDYHIVLSNSPITYM